MASLVSVVVPYYNGAEYVEAALRSVDNQTYEELEILVVDDGSNPDQLDAIKTILEDLNTDLQLVRHETNRGVSAARNTGIEAADGDYITILDQDDVMLPAKIETQVDLMERIPSLGMTLTNVVHIDANGHELEIRDLAPGIADASTTELVTNVFRCWVEQGGPLPLTTELTRASVYDDVGMYDTSLYGANDRDFLFRVAAEYGVQVIDEPLLKKRYHDDNASTASRELLEDRIRLTDTAVEHHPSLTQYADRRLAFLWLLSVREHVSNGRLRAALTDYLRALRVAPTFTAGRTAYFPVKVVRGEK